MKDLYNHEEALAEAKKEIQEKNGVDEKENISGNETENLNRTIILKDGRNINFDFGKMTGESIISLKKRYATLRKKNASMIEEFDDFYYMLVAEYTTGVDYKQFLKLAYKDFIKVRNVVRDFLGEEE